MAGIQTLKFLSAPFEEKIKYLGVTFEKYEGLKQTCQLSKFHRDTHGLGYQLTVSRFGLQISW